jgi:pimeloyl-ACP methyl ester carboxylesterase
MQPPSFPAEPLPRGDGRTVLVLPGFLTGDWATARYRAFLASRGFDVVGSGIRFNSGPTRTLVKAVETLLFRTADRVKGPVLLAGTSLGGTIARGLSHRHPDRVAKVVTLCSPIRFPVETSLAPFVWALEPFHDPGFLELAPGMAGNPKAPVTAIYSHEDGIVDWRSCLQDEDATHTNALAPGAHTTMGSNPIAQAITSRALSA